MVLHCTKLRCTSLSCTVLWCCALWHHWDNTVVWRGHTKRRQRDYFNAQKHTCSARLRVHAMGTWRWECKRLSVVRVNVYCGESMQDSVTRVLYRDKNSYYLGSLVLQWKMKSSNCCVMYCTENRSIALPCFAWYCTALYCDVLHLTTLYCTALQSIALHCVLHYMTWYYIS